MNYFMSLTIWTVVITFSATLSHGIIQKFPEKSRRRIGCSKELDVYKPNVNGQWPSKTYNTTFKPSINNGQLYLTVMWIANTTNMNGFKIILKSTNRSDICIIYDYTDSVKNYPPGLYSFSIKLSMRSKHKNRDFKGLLFPLPHSGNESQVFSVDFDTRGFLDCSSYSVRFTYKYDGMNLLITLNKGPAECNFKKYEIEIFSNRTKVDSTIICTQENMDLLETTMELNICKGKYQISVAPYDEYWQDRSRCVCKDAEKLCRSCMNTITEELYLIPARSCLLNVTPLKEPEDDRSEFIFQICLGLSLALLLTISIAYWKYTVHFRVQNQGIVLFLDDHEPHTNAVTKLVQYLNECHLRVSLASTFLQNLDIPNQLVVMTEALKSDFILLVLSNALQKRMEAWDKQQDYVEFFKEVNSNILTKQFLEILMASNKLHVCKFDHVDGFGHWPKPCYSLPTDLTKMIMDLSGLSRSQRMILCKSWKSHSLSTELHKGIQKAILYEESHENWFQEKYVCPRNVVDSYIAVDETSRTESFISSPKLKEIFTIYQDKFTKSKTHPIITESIDSEAVSLNMEEINAKNLQL